MVNTMGSSTSKSRTLNTKNLEIQQLKYQLEYLNMRDTELQIILIGFKIMLHDLKITFRHSNIEKNTIDSINSIFDRFLSTYPILK